MYKRQYFDFGLSAGWIDYQFVLAFQVILQHIGTRQSGIFRAAAVFSVGGRPCRLAEKGIGSVVDLGQIIIIAVQRHIVKRIQCVIQNMRI